jgi:hypothetical protein
MMKEKAVTLAGFLVLNYIVAFGIIISHTFNFHVMYLMDLNMQVRDLFLLALPIACVAWTVTHEEVFREARDYCVNKSSNCKSLVQRKFFYLFTCEYCFSHYVTILFLLLSGYHLLFPDWRGYITGGFALVWIANIYMSLFAFVRIGMKKERIEANIKEEELQEVKGELLKQSNNDGA